MTLHRYFKLILDWNSCLLKKISLGCLQSVQTYLSHESFTGNCASNNSRLSYTVDCIVWIFTAAKICSQTWGSQFPRWCTQVQPIDHICFLKIANCNLGKKESNLPQSWGTTKERWDNFIQYDRQLYWIISTLQLPSTYRWGCAVEEQRSRCSTVTSTINSRSLGN